MKRFRIKLNIGICGDVTADHYEVSEGAVRFYDPQFNAPVAVYALASVCSVEEVTQSESRGFIADRYQPRGGFDPWYLSGRRGRKS